MDQFDLGEIEAGDEKPGVFRGAKWRSGIGRRLLERLKLLVTWLRRTVMPHYGWRVGLSMILITSGRLLDAASFVAGVHFLTYAFSHNSGGSGDLQMGLVWAAAGIGGVIALGSALGYFGSKLAVGIVLEYERSCLIEGISIVRHHQEGRQKLSDQEVDSIIKQAPRMMARSLLQIIGACTSFVLMLAGLVVCVALFYELTIIILIGLLLLSPLYVLASVHGTNIGHSIRLNASASSRDIKKIQKKWTSTKKFDRETILQEINESYGYKAYRDAYGARLILPHRNHLLSNLTLAFVVMLSFIWFASKIDLTASALASIISYMISLRLFAGGLAGVFSGLQVINTSLPFYLLYLTRDPRIATDGDSVRA